ncbi:hypothetical protein FEK35_11640 [Nocardia cyriacigeorgica]|uniref:Uncharacterized protein n=1 Tax=Nocardia cyriacigeorgica TaxID=135487 RepID=A0A5R8PEN9_9NOCA|nr:hypothetical protein [Nocardia cyriacigeorgica]TLG12154.1 hypothetical protein FEK35_11640 [Nocardia cyriacigeorgica]
MAHSFAVAGIAIFSTVAVVALVTGAVAHVIGARARRTADFCFVGDWTPPPGISGTANVTGTSRESSSGPT